MSQDIRFRVEDSLKLRVAFSLTLQPQTVTYLQMLNPTLRKVASGAASNSKEDTMLDHFNASALAQLSIAELHGLLARYRNEAENAQTETERSSATAKTQAVKLALSLKL